MDEDDDDDEEMEIEETKTILDDDEEDLCRRVYDYTTKQKQPWGEYVSMKEIKTSSSADSEAKRMAKEIVRSLYVLCDQESTSKTNKTTHSNTGTLRTKRRMKFSRRIYRRRMDLRCGVWQAIQTRK